jgi:hypothetical protein
LRRERAFSLLQARDRPTVAAVSGWRRPYSADANCPRDASRVGGAATLADTQGMTVHVTTEPEDRRLSHRVKVCGVAVLRAGSTTVLCRITDLSTGGIGLRTEETRATVRIGVGATVSVDLQLDPRQALRVSHEGTVRHVDIIGGRIGVAFDASPAQLQDPRFEPIESTVPALRVVEGSGAVRRAAFRWGRRR